MTQEKQDLSALLREQQIESDAAFLQILERHRDAIQLGQLIYEAREAGASSDALLSARIWVASARRRGLVDVEEQGIRLVGIDDLDSEVQRLLREQFTNQGITSWLRSPNPSLGGRTPLHEYKAQGRERLVACLEAMADGVFVEDTEPSDPT